MLDVTVRALSSLITKMLGKKQVSQLSLFDYVIGISIGNFAAEMTINLESNELESINFFPDIRITRGYILTNIRK